MTFQSAIKILDHNQINNNVSSPSNIIANFVRNTEHGKRSSKRRATKKTSIDLPTSASRKPSEPRSQIERRNCKGETALHRAAIKGDIKQCENLISNGHSIDCCDNAGWTPLHEACSRGFDDVVQVLLQNGAKPNQNSLDGDTALHDAISAKATKCVQLLIQYGADTNLRNAAGQLPHEICEDDEIQRIMLDCKATDAAVRKLPGEVTNDDIVMPLEYLHAHSMRDIVISWTGFSASRQSDVEKLSNQLVDAALKPNSKLPKVSTSAMSSKTTHLICAINEDLLANRTLSFLRGLAYGCNIINQNWLSESIKHSYAVNPRLFLIEGTTRNDISKGPERRLQKLDDKGLFNGWQFFLVGRFDTFSRAQLSSLLNDLNAKVLHQIPNKGTWKSQYDVSVQSPHGVFILYDDTKGRKECSLPNGWPNSVPFKFVGVDWLCNCIEFHELLPTC